MNFKFSIGDVVYLNSNPKIKMTVDFVLGDKPANKLESYVSKQLKNNGYKDGDVNCTWLDGTTLKDAFFKAEMLTKD